MSNEIIEAQASALQAEPRASATPGDLVRYALDQGADIDRLEKLMAMQIQWEEREAKKAYVAAMAEFKKNAPEIYKSKLVEFSGTSYMHATLGDVAKAVIESLARHGFSHRWDVEQPGDGRIVVRCTITHDLGHSETNTMESSADNSGKKNSIQAIASAVTYLQRYTLLAACGLATQDMPDDDGRGSDKDFSLLNTWVSAAQSAETLAELESTWKIGVKSINTAGDIEAYNAFKRAVSARKAELDATAQEGANGGANG